VMQVLEDDIAEGGFHQVATANVDFLIKSIHDDELQEALCRCGLVLPDGMPLVWASQLMGSPLKERVAGADLEIVRTRSCAVCSARRVEQGGYKICTISITTSYVFFLIEAIPTVCRASGFLTRLRAVGPPLSPLGEPYHLDLDPATN
jgi:hypothetical protein